MARYEIANGTLAVRNRAAARRLVNPARDGELAARRDNAAAGAVGRVAARCEVEVRGAVAQISSAALVYMAGHGGMCRALARDVLLVRGIAPDGNYVGKAAARRVWSGG